MEQRNVSTLEQARADMHEALSELRYVAMDGLARLDRERALDDEVYGKFMRMGMVQWAARSTACKLRGHDWHDIPKPLTIKRWCGRCYRIENA